MAKAHRKTVDTVLIFLGTVSIVLLLVLGGLAWKASDFALNQVRTELAAQKIFFPPKGSPALDPNEFPGLQQYAGQQVDTGPEAKAYANEYIGAHLKKIANGQTYAEVSSQALKDPTNAVLQKQKQSLFQGETLRGLLLSAGYAYWTFGLIAKYAAIALFAAAATMLLLVWAGLIHRAKL